MVFTIFSSRLLHNYFQNPKMIKLTMSLFYDSPCVQTEIS